MCNAPPPELRGPKARDLLHRSQRAGENSAATARGGGSVRGANPRPPFINLENRGHFSVAGVSPEQLPSRYQRGYREWFRSPEWSIGAQEELEERLRRASFKSEAGKDAPDPPRHPSVGPVNADAPSSTRCRSTPAARPRGSARSVRIREVRLVIALVAAASVGGIAIDSGAETQRAHDDRAAIQSMANRYFAAYNRVARRPPAVAVGPQPERELRASAGIGPAAVPDGPAPWRLSRRLLGRRTHERSPPT